MTNEQARETIRNLLDNDPFSQWLGIELLDVKPGTVKLGMKVHTEMLNGFSVAHGAIPYALADSALAFAANSRNKLSMSLTNNISYLHKIENGDQLVAIAKEMSIHKRYGVYRVDVDRHDHTQLAVFRGTVYRSDRAVDKFIS